MGLSNEERISKLYWSIHRLTAVAAEMPEGDKFTYTGTGVARIKALADQLWHAFLGNQSNPVFWMLGGDADSPVKGPEGAWSAAIVGLCDSHRDDPSRVNLDDLGRDDPFNPFDSFLDARGLIGQAEGGDALKAVFDIYGWAEAIVYALRRYNDKLSASLQGLSKIVSDLLGACYGVFVHNEVYGRAYVLNRLLEALYGGRYAREGTDPVRDWFLKDGLHHRLTRPMRDNTLAEVIEWDKWRLTHKMTPENRLILALRISGRRFHYDHEFKDLLKAAKGMKPRPRIKVLEAEFAKCQKAHGERDEQSMVEYREEKEREANYTIHGFRSYDWSKKGKK